MYMLWFPSFNWWGFFSPHMRMWPYSLLEFLTAVPQNWICLLTFVFSYVSKEDSNLRSPLVEKHSSLTDQILLQTNVDCSTDYPQHLHPMKDRTIELVCISIICWAFFRTYLQLTFFCVGISPCFSPIVMNPANMSTCYTCITLNWTVRGFGDLAVFQYLTVLADC